MITLDDAVTKANEYLDSIETMPPMKLVLLLDDTLEFKYGWVFFYQSQEYVKTGDFLDGVTGNAPIIVNKYDGSLHVTGTAHTIEKYVKEYIQKQDSSKS